MKKIVIVLVFHLLAVNAFAAPIKVTLLNPGGTHWFWQMTIDFMRAAAEDLDIELEVITSDWDHFLTVEQAEKVVGREHPPEYLITGNEKSNAGKIIQIADQAKVHTFLFSNGFVDPKDNARFRQPRVKYTYWIGSLIPDNFSAGYQTGKALIHRALQRGLIDEDGKVPMVAIGGTHLTHASDERVRGLRAAIAEFEDKVVLLQVFPGDWTALRAEEIGRGIFRRYKTVTVVWCVNDTTAFGAMDAAVSEGRKPG
ncbi:MAG: ABC transporter substrate-binding protein [Desulfopila sp.]|jgi:ABC-type sugar transport system substrate-binding protein|nr:ABC transporter substrate-binding protein [Desulfopila sp.]